MKKLFTAIIENDASVVKKLLQADASLTTRLVEMAKLYNSGIFHWIYVGDTALHLAAAGYRVEIVRLLLAAGADPNAAENMRRSSPVHYAADGFIAGPAGEPNRQVETLRCLVENGGNIHLQDKNGATPLHRAVRTRSAAAVKFLLQAGSEPTARNKPGSTPFHLAVQNTGRGGSGESAAIEGQREIIETFLALGVSPKLKNASGKTVADSAQSAWVRELLGRH